MESDAVWSDKNLTTLPESYSFIHLPLDSILKTEAVGSSATFLYFTRLNDICS